MDRKKEFILWFDSIDRKDVGLVGGKNSSLGEMVQKLGSKGVLVPNGFAVTAHSYFHYLEANKINETIKDILKDLDSSDIHGLQSRGAKVRQAILNASFPEDLEKAIREAYSKLSKKYGTEGNLDVAVRSSATAEDLPDASFAGQQETFLNIVGADSLMEACKRCMASLFTNRAISYREEKKFDHFLVGLSIGVQLMVRSDRGSAGVMFSIDTESGFPNAVLINGSYGLGENVVQGAVTPDEFLVFKPKVKEGFKSLLKKRLGTKEMTMIYSPEEHAAHQKPVVNIKTPKAKQETFCLSDDEVIKLAKWAIIIEDHYGCPMDIEWAKNGKDELFIVQARPETVVSQKKDVHILRNYHLKGGDQAKVLASGAAVGSKVGSGTAQVIHEIKDIASFEEGNVLITDQTDPDWEPILKKARAVVTNRGGRTCHAAIISRELGIPCIVGCETATMHVPDGAKVTVDTSTGEKGRVLEGIIPFEIEEINLQSIPSTKTKICLLLGNPEAAFSHSFLPNDGVGLARMEFIISSSIKVHPLALLNPDKLDRSDQREILHVIGGGNRQLTAELGKQHFIDKLSEGVALISAGFWPKPVILRFSDFKSDEYANLLGGKQFEPVEDNPMIGWRGASRYYDPNYREGFALECAAIRRVREELGLSNLQVMIPFVRTVDELKSVLEEMKKNGLERGKEGLTVVMMCELPSNAVLADEFLEHIDGFSIGSNDLTQLTLGLDRNSATVARLYDERNPAVKSLISTAIRASNKKQKYIGICGQAPSDYPEFCEFLVEENIGSISVQPDRIIQTRLLVAEKEKEKK